MNASGRLNTCKSSGSTGFGLVASGARVRNAYATCLIQGDSPWKRGLTPHNISFSHVRLIKTTVV